MMKIIITDEELKKLNEKFFRDPEWNLLERVFRDFLEPLTRIDTLELNDDDKSVKAEIRARLEFTAAVDNFFKNAAALANSVISKDERDPRDSLE